MAHKKPVPGAVALLLLVLAAGAQAQDATLKPVTITDTANPAAADISGFGDFPRKEVPISTTVIGNEQIELYGARRLADLIRFDPSIADAYNAAGYWDFLSIRGFTLDNRFNYRREGLPISAQTMIPLDNKSVEILKGTSGIQAGTSAPGGLVNYVVKRPTARDLREVRLEVTQRASVLAAADLGGRFGEAGAFGYRLNVAAERLRPQVHNLEGERGLVAFAGDWRLGRDSLLEAEFEWSTQKQASQAGFSLLGAALPEPVDPRRNLNDQPWLQPTQFDALTGTVRFSQALAPDWRWSAQLGTQRLRTDDYTAFPFGCSSEGNFDRFCSDGSFDYYDFRSEDERRRQDAGQLKVNGRLTTGSVVHDLSFGVLASRVRNRFNPSPFNFAGIGHIGGGVVVPPAPLPADPSTNRDERSLEFSAADAIRWTPRLATWAGLRHTRLDRSSIRTDGSRAASYDQGVTTPFLAATYKVTRDLEAYASWGQGIESAQVPGNGSYTNPGVVLPALRSTQQEVGLRSGDDATGWEVIAFRIKRPVTNFELCAGCEGAYDGDALHQGAELRAHWTSGPWKLWGGAMLLDAERRNSSAAPAINGLRPTNVPEFTLRGGIEHQVRALPGLSLIGGVSHEGGRAVTTDNTVMLPSWTRFDALLHYKQRIGTTDTSWTLGIDNVFDRRYWRESPNQFGHIYLYPGAPRTIRVAFTAAL